MHKWEKEMRQDYRYKYEEKTQSFSSSLLDEIYRSISEADSNSKYDDLKFYRETLPNKPTTVKNVKKQDDDAMAILRRTRLIEEWMNKKVNEKSVNPKYQKKQNRTEIERKSQIDDDSLFFSSTSSSSDTSFGGFSSSDTESIYGGRLGGHSFGPARPKPVKTSVSSKKQSTLFYEQRELHMVDDYHYNSSSDYTPRLDGNIIKSKSRALKIYNNLKKVKQPISPGGKLVNFINSIFTPGNAKKSKNFDEERKYYKSTQPASTCSSASSFSRSCLNKNSPSTRERLRNGDTRSVRFYPVSVTVGEDSRPYGHKILYREEQNESTLMSVSLPTAWKIGESPATKNVDDEIKYHVAEKSRRVEEVAREFLKDYHQKKNNNIKNDNVIMRDVRRNYDHCFEDEDEDEDDGASCSSSDLFELDHLSAIGSKDRYCEELPVYETTHVKTNLPLLMA